ncbi:hypothetical protein CP533_0016 [Ophiocordyceps camponoti-saundersi (nom. inval.)]|nr:hypothetical protein CP533_0016 [Ophiocordyceps camponoti-saundersi (nom. inval.)]
MRSTAAILALVATLGHAQVQDPATGEQFTTFARYSMAAYCPTLYDGFDASDVCSNSQERSCSDFDRTTTTREFLNNVAYGVGGFVASNPNRRHIVAAFKGSDTMFDYITDVSKQLVASELCEGCLAHKGFYSALLLLEEKLVSSVRAELMKAGQENYRVVVTGHSLGGAIATLAGIHLRNQNISCDIYTYGAPLVGNWELANHISSQDGFTGRITNGQDVVTAIPQISWSPRWTYAHSYPEYWYDKRLGGVNRQYETNQPRRCENYDDCSSSQCFGWFHFLRTWTGCSVTDHWQYGAGFDPCSPPVRAQEKVASMARKAGSGLGGWRERARERLRQSLIHHVSMHMPERVRVHLLALLPKAEKLRNVLMKGRG